jgi:predicted Zn-dependent protease
MLRKTAFALMAVFAIGACSKVPITGRKQVNLLPEDQMVAMGVSTYNQFKQEHPPVTGTPEANLVTNVGAKIADGATRYLRMKNLGERVAGYRWEYILVNSPEVNAWCLPGGKITVYSGILPITQTEAGLATVIGHEVAHAIARHGNERMSQTLLAQAGGLALDVYLSQHPTQSADLYRQAYGVGVTVGALLPYSRLQESEADKLGLIFMAMAGYNPQEAVDFWQRMRSAKKGDGAPPEFLSTHPSDETRIADIKKYLPTAMHYYEKYGSGVASSGK